MRALTWADLDERRRKMLTSLLETTIIGIACPARGCACPVFVPADSDREEVDCNWCDARWVTHQELDGKVILKPRQEDR